LVIATPRDINQNTHCRQTILNLGFVSYNNPFFSRTLQDDHPRGTYRQKVEGFQTTIIHWGQRKLLMSEIEFLTLIGPEKLQNSIVVYAGAAPGTHTLFLTTLFPQVDKWILVDPARFDESLTNKQNIELVNNIFTDVLAANIHTQYSNKSIYFVSDIRTADSNKQNNVEVEQRVHSDMIAQSQWHNILKSRRSMLKFRLPWDIGAQSLPPSLEYLAGDVYLPVWGPTSTTESRLITHEWDGIGTAPTKVYDNKKYEEQMFFFNRFLRPSLYHHPIQAQGIDNCYDCRAELEILRAYISLFNTERNARTGQVLFLNHKIALMSETLSQRISWGKRTLADPNVPTEQRRANIERRQQPHGVPEHERALHDARATLRQLPC
jgi:hypothetical protein